MSSVKRHPFCLSLNGVSWSALNLGPTYNDSSTLGSGLNEPSLLMHICASTGMDKLTHLPHLPTIWADDIFKCISWMKKFECWLKFHLSLFLRLQLTLTQQNRQQTIIWTNVDPIHWRIYAALGGDKLTLVSTMPLALSVYVIHKKPPKKHIYLKHICQSLKV